MRIVLGEAIFWVAAACCLVAQVAIIRSVLLPHAPTPGPDQVPRPRTGTEIAWALLPALALIGVFALTWRAIHAPARPESMHVSAAAPALGDRAP